VIAVLGFGEAGSLIAADLVAVGAAVRGFDPKVPPPAGVVGADSDAEAVVGASLVLSLNSAGEAVAALTASIGALGPHRPGVGRRRRLGGAADRHRQPPARGPSGPRDGGRR